MIAREEGAMLARRFAAAGLPSAAFEAEYLVRAASGLTRAAYFAGAPLEPGALDRIACWSARRLAHEPAAYITGRREFFGLDFEVTPAVLIPRPETELLVEVALAELRGAPGHPIVVDAGTGCGCVAVSVAHGAPAACVVAVDSSVEALRVAARNCRRHAAAVSLVRGDLAGPVARADVVLANLPYIPTAEIDGLQPEVRDWEPRGALDGGPGGLALIRRLVADCGRRLRPRLLALETGCGQADAVAALARAAGAKTERRRDLAGHERVVLARWQ